MFSAWEVEVGEAGSEIVFSSYSGVALDAETAIDSARLLARKDGLKSCAILSVRRLCSVEFGLNTEIAKGK